MKRIVIITIVVAALAGVAFYSGSSAAAPQRRGPVARAKPGPRAAQADGRAAVQAELVVAAVDEAS